MGVPKFYRWLSERYPCLSEVVKEYQIPEFDNLYLDMNGIIHICSHPNDDDPHFRITQEKIFADIFHYIEWLFRLIKPRKVFFMAVDGVAPRAKMNQQRGRRFRSAREATEADNRARERGEILPTEERFDSNCITPGTEFMVRLQEQLKYFVNMKISNDKLWQGPRIFLSGHETPGEGEHKIMDFIRYERSQPSYDPNTRHCLYGLDADLIMLGLCTHDPHFSLLREEIRYTGKAQKRIPTPEETTYHLLHLSLLREYLEHEFSPVRDKLPFPYDVDSIVDDWVMMGFLVGNDFIPNLPHLHIVHGALPTLYKTYMDVLPTLDGYINEGGSLNLARFEKYMEKLSECDYENFSSNQYADLKWLESKNKANGFVPRHGRRRGHRDRDRGQNLWQSILKRNTFESLTSIKDDDFQDDTDDVPVGKLIDFSDGEGGGDIEVDDDEEEEEEDKKEEGSERSDDEIFSLEFRNHKRNYYMEKLEYKKVTAEVLRDQAECFVRAVQWNLHYYYNGVCSWSWFYPHHYAPYISDIRNFSQMTLEFDYGTPFRPFEQLLAVLPSASKKLLPQPYWFLMCDSSSPVIDYYPVDFTTDLNGKQQDWEAVVQIPFIDEKRLLSAMLPINDQLTQEEKNRNTHGPCLLYTYSEEPLGTYPSALQGKFPDISPTWARRTEIKLDMFRVETSKLVKGLCPGVRLDVYFPGFPTLKHIPHTAKLKNAEVKVFQMVSRGENMILKIEKGLDMDIQTCSEELLGAQVYVGWPHLIEAKVVTVSDGRCRYTVVGGKENDRSKTFTQKHELTREETETWRLQSASKTETYINRWGVEIGETNVLVFAVPLVGRSYACAHGGKVTLEKLWSKSAVPFALQTVIKDIQVQDPSFQQYQTLEELFPINSVCFLLASPNYGCMAKTEEVCTKRKGYIQVKVEALDEPDLDSILNTRANSLSGYMPGYLAAQKLGISGLLLSRITGTFFVKGGSRSNPSSQQRINIGLNLKFNKRNEEAVEYAKKVGDSWTYSHKTVEDMESYLQSFPELFDYLQLKIREENYYEEEIVAACSRRFDFKEIQTFLKSLPSHSATYQQCGSNNVDSSVVKDIEAAADKVMTCSGSTKIVIMQVKARFLFKPNYFQGCSLPDPQTTYQLFDRVVNVRGGYTVPLGLRGTIIGLQMADKESDIVYQIVFDKEFPGGLTLRCSPYRGYLLPGYALINITHGSRLEHSHNKPTAVVHPQYAKPNGSSLVFENSKFGGGSGKNGRTEKGYRQSYASAASSARPISPTVQTALHISATHGNYPNTLNHSPNSPFIARQPQLLRTRPQFVTSKMPTSNYQVLPRQGVASQKTNTQGASRDSMETEFQEIWKNLLQTSKSSEAPDSERLQTISVLQQAAKCLPKEQMSHEAEPVTVDRNVEVHLRQGPPPMPAFGLRPAGTNGGSEFASMFKALENQTKSDAVESVPGVKDSDSLSELLQLLSVTEPRSAPTVPTSLETTQSSQHNPASVATQSSHQYSKQISVEQLFKEVRESDMMASNKNNVQNETGAIYGGVKPNQETVVQQQQAIENFTPGSVGFSYVTAIMNLFQITFGSVPTYEYISVGPTRSIKAKVTLPDGSYHYGVVCTSNQAAAESAAKEAYNCVVLKSKELAIDQSSNHGRTASAVVLPSPQQQTVMLAANRTGAPVVMNPVHHAQASFMQSLGRHQLQGAHMHPHMIHPQATPFGIYPPPSSGQRQPPVFPGTFLPPPPGGYLHPPPALPTGFFPRPQYVVDQRLPPKGWAPDLWQGQHLQQQSLQFHQLQQRSAPDNPFVPLQVTKHKVAPKKYSSNDSKESEPSHDSEQLGTNKQSTGASKSSSRETNWRSRPAADSNDSEKDSRGQAEPRASSQANQTGNRRGKNSGKSRLAINFSSSKRQ